MVKLSTSIIMLALTFSFGLFLGLILQLQGVSSPHASPVRHPRDTLTDTADPEQPPAISKTLLRGPKVSGGVDERPQRGRLHNGADHQEISPHLNRLGGSKLLRDNIPIAEGHELLQHQVVSPASSSDRHPSKQTASSTSKSDSQQDNPVLEASDAVSVTIRLKPDDPSSSFKASGDGLFSSLQDVVHGVYWTPAVESLVPEGFSLDTLSSWRHKMAETRVTAVVEGCGRMQNRQVTLGDGSKACARYRINNDQILGDILSYYLSLLLDIHQVPPSMLVLADPRNATWASVAGEVTAVQWHHERPLVLVPWLDNLQPVFIPTELQGSDGAPRKLHPTPDVLSNRTSAELRDLVQWSDLIIFDYLTANLDRVVNNMFNHQWNADMMVSPTHNLEAMGDSGLLVFLDNEAGLLHSYRLLDKYNHFHQDLLQALCIFRPSTAARVKELVTTGTLGRDLEDMFHQQEPLHHLLPRLPQKNVKTLHSRLQQVYEQIQHCEHLYAR